MRTRRHAASGITERPAPRGLSSGRAAPSRLRRRLWLLPLLDRPVAPRDGRARGLRAVPGGLRALPRDPDRSFPALRSADRARRLRRQRRACRVPGARSRARPGLAAVDLPARSLCPRRHGTDVRDRGREPAVFLGPDTPPVGSGPGAIDVPRLPPDPARVDGPDLRHRVRLDRSSGGGAGGGERNPSGPGVPRRRGASDRSRAAIRTGGP